MPVTGVQTDLARRSQLRGACQPR